MVKGVYVLSNAGILEATVEEPCEYIKYRFVSIDSKPGDFEEAEIMYDDGGPFFCIDTGDVEDPIDNKFYLHDFMRQDI